MDVIKNLFKRTVLIIILISTLITFLATPASYAELQLEDDEFYYAGTTEGAYVASFDIFSWLLNNIGDIADWLLGIITMGFRMVFVGWTALLEKALTWALESTTGVSASGALIESSTDMSSISDPSSNITVEAIVYNKVAGLNIDFFELDFDRGITGTGKKLVCKKCEMVVAGTAEEEGCISITEAEAIKSDAENIKKQISNGTYDFSVHCTCGCNGCDECSKYVSQLVADKPIVIKIRELVATWYSIIRILAMAAMLIALIGIGIKMALSTIASDKALYKRMLVDWVVGVIILFAIHYFMIFCIYMNGIIVKTVEESAQSINKVQMQEMMGEETEVSNAELEIKVYEEVRTRAYDARLINGMTGMIMYMTLVFFAFKYTIIYLKRYLTILVLTLMGPGVGVAYALQKALSGKSSALTTWMTEYIMNVIIQIIHALIYAIFISQAMVLSLKSVAGMVLALILMNYTTKADQLFKKIFKFGGADSLAGHTAGAMESTLQGLQTAKAMATGAKPLAKALTNTPYAKAVKGAGKLALAGVAGAGAGLSRLVDRLAEEPEDNKPDSSSDDDFNDGGEEQGGGGTGPLNGVVLPTARTREGRTLQRMLVNTAGTKADGDKLRANLEAATKKVNAAKASGKPAEIEAAQIERLAALNRYNEFQQTSKLAPPPKGKGKRIIELENVFESTAGRNPLHVGWAALFGTTSFNTKTMKFENSGDKGVFNMYKKVLPQNILGWTPEDRKKLWAVDKDMRKALLGMGGIFVGMASFVAQPKTGMALMAGGYAATKGTLGKKLNVNGGNGKYTFSRYGSHSINTIKNSALVRAKQEHDALIAKGIALQHPNLADKLATGKASAITIGEIGGELGVLFATQNSPYSDVATAAMIDKYGSRGTKFMKNRALGGKMDELARHFAKQERKQRIQFIEEATDMERASIEARIELRKTMFESSETLSKEEKDKLGKELAEDKKRLEEVKDLKAYLEEQGYGIDEDGELVEVDKSATKTDDIYAAILMQAESELEEARKAGTMVDSKAIAQKYDVAQDDMVDSIGSKTIGQKEVALVNKTIDDLLQKLSQGGEFDLSSENAQDKLILLLSAELAKSNLLTNGQSAEDLFKGGRNGLKSELKKKDAKRRAAVKAATKKLEEAFTPEGATAMKEVIAEVAKSNTDKGRKESEITVSEVMSRIEKSKDGSLQVKASDGSVRASISDGSKAVSGRTPLNETQLEALQQFMQVTRAAVPPAKGKKVSKAKSDEIIAKAKETRETKLQQAMLALIDEEDAPVVVSQDGKSSTQDILKELSQKESDYVTATVRDLLELKELNAETARLNIDKVKGSKSYTDSVKKESQARIDLAVLEKEILIENANLEELNRTNAPKEEVDRMIKKIRGLEDSKTDKVSKLEDAERKTTKIGPVVNLEQYINSGFNYQVEERKDRTDGSKSVKDTGKVINELNGTGNSKPNKTPKKKKGK